MTIEDFDRENTSGIQTTPDIQSCGGPPQLSQGGQCDPLCPIDRVGPNYGAWSGSRRATVWTVGAQHRLNRSRRQPLSICRQNAGAGRGGPSWSDRENPFNGFPDDPRAGKLLRLPAAAGHCKISCQDAAGKIAIHYLCPGGIGPWFEKRRDRFGIFVGRNHTVQDLQAEILGTEKLVMIASPDHPLARRNRIRTEMLADQTLLLSRADCSYRRLLEQMMQDKGCQANIIIEFNSLAAIIANVIAGLGVTVIPQVAVEADVKSKRLVVLPWTESGLEVAQLMIWHHEKWLTPVLKHFMDTAREVLASG